MNQTLQTVARKHITFDPENAEHRAAYWRLRTTGRQDAELRFVLEQPARSVLAMMQAKIADHYSTPPAPLPAEVPALRKRERSA